MAKKKPVAAKKMAPKQQSTAKDKTKATQDEAGKVLEQVKKDFQASWDYTAGSWHDRWMNNYKLYNNQRVKRGYYGISDTFVPMVFSTIETMTSAVFGSKPRFNYLPPAKKQDQKTDILNAVVDYYWEKDQWSLKTINTGRGMFMRGTAVDYFAWDVDHPILINVPIRDFFIDPTATSIENARYMGRRYLISKAELEEFQIVDLDGDADENGIYPLKPKYTNLDQLDDPSTDATANKTDKASGNQEKTDKQEKDIFYGSTLTGEDADQIEVIEYWTNDNVYSVANRKVVIENSENYFKAKARQNGDKYPEGFMPFACARDYVDESLFYAKGEVDFIADQQEDLNDGTNQRKDAVSYTVNQMYTLDPKYGDQIDTVENLPGAVYPFEANALVPVPRGTIPPDSFNETQNIKNEIRETTAANEIVKGAPAQGSGTTATEINAQISGAGQRLNLKVTQIENEYFHRMARIIFMMIRLYVSEPMMVRIVGKDGAKWEKFDPKEYSEGDYEPRVQLQITIENQKQQFAANAKEMYAAFLNDPDVNQQELKKLVLSKGFQLDPDEVEQLMAQQPAPAAAMPGMPPMPPQGLGAPMMPGAPAGPPQMMPQGMPDLSQMPPEDMALQQAQANGGVYIDPVSGEPIPQGALM